MLQVITYEEFLPLLLGPDAMRTYHLNLDSHYIYNSFLDVTVHNSFSAAALRVGHTLIAPSTQPRDL